MVSEPSRFYIPTVCSIMFDKVVRPLNYTLLKLYVASL